jgi:hypothetical protein
MIEYKGFSKRHLKSEYVKKSVMRRNHKRMHIMLALILFVGSVIFIFSVALPNLPKTSASTEINAPKIQETSIQSQSQFNVDIIYAYAGPNNYDESLSSTFNGVSMHPASLWPDIVYFNFTHVSSAEKQTCDAKIEVYLIEISTNTGMKDSYTCFFGTNYNQKFSGSALTPALSKINELIDTRNTDGVTGIFNPNMATNQSLWFKLGSLDATTSEPSGLGLWSAGEPNSIAVSIHRIGWIAMNSNDISVIHESTGESTQLSLSKSGQGFLYNAIPQDKMSQTDAFHPIDLYRPLT